MKLTERVKYGIGAASGFAIAMIGDTIQELYPNVCPAISDSLPDYGSALWISSMMLAFKKRSSVNDLVYSSTAIPILYTLSELGQKYGVIPGTFDEKDILGFALGGLTTLVVGLASKYSNKPQTPNID